ncbi:DUF5906 domain-containing protein [Sinirhodobacter sp. WL0062]|uniref:DUF5906 domain-containing protein n=1 Tax=Rhodobacter flavimaris TaxID=2907145 RepID=A0ABS8YT10_9RHOB|nr:DUF5906 domain-containing protein [Sinirhodobacter sp. WL0062]MCE5972608.1 DUF5906 domain-containing protein [Sinirhodobacter sp. WL0062]
MKDTRQDTGAMEAPTTQQVTDDIKLSPEDWLDEELLRIAASDPIYDSTEIEQLKQTAKQHKLSLSVKDIRERLKTLRRAAKQSELAELGQTKYEAFIERMNAEFFVFTGADTVTICSWAVQSGRRVLVQRKVQDFRLLMAKEPPLFSPDAGRMLPAAEAWLRDPSRREVRGFLFEADPRTAAERAKQGFENLFEGFAVNPRQGSIEPFLRHLRDVIVAEEAPGRQETVLAYLLDCFAHLVQRPGVPLKIALVFRGRQGSGKSFVTDIIASLFRGNVFETGHADDIVGRFTDHLLNACLVIGDEALFAGSRKDADAMKRLITQDVLRLEGKHKAVLNERNRMTLILTSNHEHAVRLEPGDRRFVVLDVSDARTPRAAHAQYWDDLWSWSKSTVGKAALLHFLLERDLSRFDAQRDRPQTKARLDQMLVSLDPVYRWFLEELVQKSNLPHKIRQALIARADLSDETQQTLPEDHQVFYKKTVFEAFSAWEQEKMRAPRSMDQRLFWKSLLGILGDTSTGKKRVRGVATHILILPPVSALADLFMTALGCKGLATDLLDVAEDQASAGAPPKPSLATIAGTGLKGRAH